MDLVSHISFSVSDLQKSTSFYDAVLGAIGLKRVYTSLNSAGWGLSEDQEVFAVKKRLDKVTPPSKGFHLALHARTKEEIQDFYNQALKHGGQDNGAPGARPEYGKNYYAAFIIDPDGYELEVKLFISN